MSRYAECSAVDEGAYLISACCYVTNQFAAHLGMNNERTWLYSFFARLTYNFFFFLTDSKCYLHFWISTKHSFLLILSCKNTIGHYFYEWVGRLRRERERERGNGMKVGEWERGKKWGDDLKRLHDLISDIKLWPHPSQKICSIENGNSSESFLCHKIQMITHKVCHTHAWLT